MSNKQTLFDDPEADDKRNEMLEDLGFSDTSDDMPDWLLTAVNKLLDAGWSKE